MITTHEHYPRLSVPFRVKVGGLTITGRNMKMKVPFGSIVLIAIGAALGASGSAVEGALLGLINWQVSDPSVATIVRGKNGEVFLRQLTPGTVIVTADGDADVDTPQRFDGSIEVTFSEDEVAVLNLTGEVVTEDFFLAATAAPPEAVAA